MNIHFGKTVIDVADVDESTTIAVLCTRLKEQTGLENVKLICNGTTLSNPELKLSELPQGFTSHVLMIASNNPVATPAPRIRDDLTPEVKPKNGTMKKTPARSRDRTENEYGFKSIQTLSGFSDEWKSKELLETLANDPGILAVMKKHKWQVGALCEMFPEGYVGVSDVCVMGLNENHGQRILLRLRTDDLHGYRKVLSIKQVLCHELAHNVYGDHNDNFYMLMRSIERDCNELDWRNSKGHKVINGAEAVYRGSDEEVSSHYTAQEVHTLGGETSIFTRVFPAEVMAANAALLRLQQATANSSTNTEEVHNNTTEIQSTVIATSNPIVEEVEDAILPMKRMTDGSAKEIMSEVMFEAVQEETIPVHQETILIPPTTDIAEDTAMQIISEIENAPSIREEEQQEQEHAKTLLFAQQIEQLRVHGYARIDETMAMVFSQETSSTSSILDRIEYFRVAFDALVDYAITYPSTDTLTFLQRTFTTLLKILENIKLSPQETKYHSIKKSNPAIQRMITTVPQTFQILRAAGFQEMETVYQYTRPDPALLYIVYSLLADTTEAVNHVC